MTRFDVSRPGSLRMSRRVIGAAFLAALAVAILIGAGCMALRDSASGGVPAANRAEASLSASARASRESGEGRARFLLVRWQEPGMAPRALPLTEGAGGNSVEADAPIFIEFSAGPDALNGAVSGYAGCNRFLGSYQKLASGMRFGPLASTQMACEPARMQREIDFLNALQAPLTLVGMQPSPDAAQGRQIIWKTASGALLQFAERLLPPRGQ